MDMAVLLKFASAFVFVISLMLALAWALKKAGVAGTVSISPARRRLKIVEFLPLDSRRRLALVRRDGVEHLIVLGPEGETVVETGIPVVENVVELKGQKNAV